MIIGVASDSHDNLVKVSKAVEFFKERGVELILHAGDYIAPFTLKKFSEAGSKLIGVFGNNDCEKPLLCNVAKSYGFELHGQPLELELDGRKIVLLHGCGNKKFTKIFVEAIANTGEYDLVIYGHIHEKDYRVLEKNGRKTIILNPGEIFGGLSGTSSIAIVDLKTLAVEIIDI